MTQPQRVVYKKGFGMVKEPIPQDEMPPLPTHEEYRTKALAKLDEKHAGFLNQLTGAATTEERDTWPIKVAAAKYIQSVDDATLAAEATLVENDDPNANDDLEALVFHVGAGVAELRAEADAILAKSRAFKKLIGLASKLRGEAKAAIITATDSAQPIEGVGEALDAIETNMTAQVEVAAAQWAAS